MKDWSNELAAFASLLQKEQETGLVSQGFTLALHKGNYEVAVKMGKKFARVDIGSSGRYMVDLETGEIFGIKAYGVIHRGHRFGTLDTIHDWNWQGYTAHPVARELTARAIN